MVFFFKQKTAYEMRISDWSSDVCSSDLVGDVSVTFNGDGTVTVSGLLEDYQALVSTADGFNRLEVQAVDSKFDLGGVAVSSTQAGEPVNLEFGVVAEDEDGDTSTGPVQVIVLPQSLGAGDAETLIAGVTGSESRGDRKRTRLNSRQ